MKRDDYKLVLALLAFPIANGCSLFLGNIRPVEEKSRDYEFSNMNNISPDWDQVTRTSDNGSADMVFQSHRTGSIISITSACKKHPSTEVRHNLEELTRELLLGVSKINHREVKKLQVAKTAALQTTLIGTLDKEEVMLRTIVLQKNNCIFDLMYVAKPQYFLEDEETFLNFVSSLQIR